MDIVQRLTMHPFAVIHPDCIHIVCMGKASYFDSIECAFSRSRTQVFNIVFYILSLKTIIFWVNRSITVEKLFLVEEWSNICIICASLGYKLCYCLSPRNQQGRYCWGIGQLVVAVGQLPAEDRCRKNASEIAERCNSSALTSARERCVPSDSGFASKC